MSSDALDSSDSPDDREQARLRLLKKKRHCMDDRAKSSREQEPKRALKGPRLGGAVAVDSGKGCRPFPSHEQVASLIAKALPMVKGLPHKFMEEFTGLMRCESSLMVEGSAVARGAPPMEGRAAKDKTECCLGMMAHREDGPAFFLSTPIDLIIHALSLAFGACGLDRATVRLSGGEGLSGCMGEDRETGVCDLHLMNCVLGRSVRVSKAGGDEIDVRRGGTVLDKVAAFCFADMEDSNDWKYIAGIVHIPSADTFYCHREEGRGGAWDYRPLHSSWLRIFHHADDEGQPGIASGGYVKRVISSYVLRLRVLGGEGMPVRVFRAVQFHDSNVSVAPLLPPDVHTLTPPVQIPGRYSLGDDGVGGLRSLYNVIFHDPYERGGYWVGRKDDPARAMFGPHMHPMGFGPMGFNDRVGDVLKSGVCLMGEDDPHVPLGDALREWYESHLDMHLADRMACRRHVAGALYRVMVNAHIVDVNTEDHHGGVDIDVAIHGPSRPNGRIPLRGSTTIEVRRVNKMCQLGHMRSCVMAAEGYLALKVRKDDGGTDCGQMMVIGTREGPVAPDADKKYKLMKYLDSRGGLRDCSSALEEVGLELFPGLQRVMRDMERDAGNTPPLSMRGEQDSGMCTQEYSVDLANASHYDPTDASKGFAVWMEEGAGNGECVPDMHGWYFVFPNVMVTEERMLGQRKLGQDRCGLAIKLSHGVAIAWDGMELRHCTSLAERSGEMKWMRGRYGVFTAAKRQTVSFSPPCMGRFARDEFDSDDMEGAGD